MAILKCELKTWIIQRQQGCRPEPRKHEAQPYPADPNRRGKIKPTDGKSILMETRHDQPISIDDVQHEEHDSETRQRADVPFDRPEKQQKKWNKKMKQRYDADDPFPTA